MNVDSQNLAAQPLKAPYVGMRPFLRGEKAIFKGRDKDVVLLSNKVFASRLTILYGPSGVGKSSLLRTLLIDQIEQQDARAVYFDEWRGDNPAATLGARLIEEATERGIQDADKGSPNLVQLAQLVVSADRRTLVLILDQFEEFFATHPNSLEPLRSELSALIRAEGLDVRILLSLREEHLAALEPFRGAILELFQSTYRLEPLPPEDAYRAIVAPAKEFGVEFEEGLVDDLIKDLRIDESESSALRQDPRPDLPIDLPILQLVCGELWAQASSKNLPIIRKSLYKHLGRRPGIVDAFLRRVMPSDWRGRKLTAQLMRHLAPPHGHKVALSAEHLASVTELPLGRVKAEIDRLSSSEVRVLRTRAYEEETVYELWHDSFSRILGPWRDSVLARWRLQRWSLRVASVLTLVAAVAAAALWYQDDQQFQRNVSDVWNDPDRSPEQKFDHVASYLLWSRTGSNRFRLLERELTAHQDALPLGYGIDSSGKDFVTIPSASEQWPLELHYSDARKLDEYAFTLAWQGLARILAETWGIPAPLKMKLIRTSDYPKNLVSLQGKDIQRLDLDLATDEDKALISSHGMSKHGREFLQQFPKHWVSFEETSRGGPWHIVPRWSLPVWKASGVLGTDGSGALAFRIALELQKRPEPLLTTDAVELLLTKIEKGRPSSVAKKIEDGRPSAVAEARRVRGKQLTSDLQQLVRSQTGLKGLPYILDLLASYPSVSSSDIANNIVSDLDLLNPFLPLSLQGPPESSLQKLHAEPEPGSGTPKRHRAYEDVAIWLPEVQRDFRVYLGADLAKKMAQVRFERPLYEMIDRVRSDLLRRFGILIPYREIEFLPGGENLAADAFRIEALYEHSKMNEEAAAVAFRGDDALDRLRLALLFDAEAHRAHLVTSDSVKQELQSMSKQLQEWLAAHYTLTDLKLLLRGVVAPSDNEAKTREHAWTTGVLDQPIGVPGENNIRHADWLMASLVFWSKVDGKSPYTLVQRLRATQRSMLTESRLSTKNPEIRTSINVGLEALKSGKVNEAEEAFSKAVSIDAREAMAAFLAAYRQVLQTSVREKLLQSCEKFEAGSLGKLPKLMTDLEDLVTRKDFDKDFGAAQARRLRLCLLASFPETSVLKRRDLSGEIVRMSTSPAQWPADEAAWFGTRVLASFDSLQDREGVKTGFAYLQRALPDLTPENARTVLTRVIEICFKDGPTRQCREQLPLLAAVRSDAATVALIAYVLSYSNLRRDAEEALRLVRIGNEQLGASTLSERERKDAADMLDCTQARAYLILDPMGALDVEKFHDAEAALVRLLASPAMKADSATLLTLLRERQNRLAEMIPILDEMISRSPNEPELYGARLKAGLSVGDKEGVSSVAALAARKVVRDKGKITEKTEGYAFVSALGLLMTQGEGWERASREFLGTKHHYTPYIGMILYSMMAGKGAEEARDIIRRRWTEADPETWKVRLREGDVTAFREMLTGYYLKEIPREALFSDLEDQIRFDKSDIRHLPMTREEMLCEAYLYDALLALADRNVTRAQERFELTVRTNQLHFFEFAMAKYFLQQK